MRTRSMHLFNADHQNWLTSRRADGLHILPFSEACLARLAGCLLLLWLLLLLLSLLAVPLKKGARK